MDTEDGHRTRINDNYRAAAQQLCSPPRRASSPIVSSPTRTRSSQKERRNPSVTPRRFRKFFNRSSDSLPGRRILGSVNERSLNQLPLSPTSLRSDFLSSDPLSPSLSQVSATENTQKRKREQQERERDDATNRDEFDDLPQISSLPSLFTGSASVDAPRGLSAFQQRQGPGFQFQTTDQDRLGDWRKATLSKFFRASRGQAPSSKDQSAVEVFDDAVERSVRTKITQPYEPNPVRKFHHRGFEAQLLDREHGFSSYTSRRNLSTPAFDPRADTAAFYSKRTDFYHNSHNPGNPVPFCLASSKTTSITVVGDESGHLRFLDIEGDWQSWQGSDDQDPAQSRQIASLDVHDNTIMDVAFSEDESRLVTASGDRTCKIIDVATQTVAVDLKGLHTSNLRQVSFQPGHSNSVLSTSDMSGIIAIWDLRCRPMPARTFSVMDRATKSYRPRDTDLPVTNGSAINRIDQAHWREFAGRRTGASLTSIQWFPVGREHLLLSGSEANASVKLWDTRYMKPAANRDHLPVAKTPIPSHHVFRAYGLSSIAMSPDASRFYTVCRDNTVYAYSTAHLMLGEAPELVNAAMKRRPREAEGLGPLYGFKNEQLDISSFYIRGKIRPASNRGGPEMLAVGSNAGCPILFPTDERYLRSAWARHNHTLKQDPVIAPSQYRPAACTPMSLTPSNCDIPIYQCGTPLINGHTKEVTNVAWARGGQLVSASDDGMVRRWRAGAAEARHFRQVGDFGGERWMAGWANVDGWDEEDDDDEDGDEE